jgi:hypothetical protein
LWEIVTARCVRNRIAKSTRKIFFAPQPARSEAERAKDGATECSWRPEFRSSILRGIAGNPLAWWRTIHAGPDEQLQGPGVRIQNSAEPHCYQRVAGGNIILLIVDTFEISYR